MSMSHGVYAVDTVHTMGISPPNSGLHQPQIQSLDLYGPHQMSACVVAAPSFPWPCQSKWLLVHGEAHSRQQMQQLRQEQP